MLMPDHLLEEGRLLFNRGQYFEAHEVWEDLWRLQQDPYRKTCCQGLIQAAVGLHHLDRGNTLGARGQFRKSVRNLGTGATQIPELDIAGLIGQLKSLLDSQLKLPQRPVITRLK
jgi:predicted metal-dependent hydrolase